MIVVFSLFVISISVALMTALITMLKMVGDIMSLYDALFGFEVAVKTMCYVWGS
jgi:hypothetical protein